jgi:hypothetical protein
MVMSGSKATSPERSSVADVQEQLFMAAATGLISRAELAATLGKSYDGDRDMYEALGYNNLLSFEDFDAFYRRTFAKRIVEAPAVDSWRLDPIVTDAEGGEETAFSRAWRDLAETHRIYHYMQRVDIAAGIGQYGALLMGLDDQAEVTQQVETAKGLRFLQVFSQTNADIMKVEEDIKKERFGLPLSYGLSVTLADGKTTKTLDRSIHWSRVIHVADGLLENDLYGTPRLEAAYNYIENAEKVLGGAGEAFWRGCRPGLVFKAGEDAQIGPQSKTELETQIENYVHKFSNTMRLKGLDVQELAPKIVSPLEHFEVFIAVLSVITGIPKRILMGSERGELGSSQDEKNWLGDRMTSRRTKFNEPVILRPFIDRMVEFKALPEPTGGKYTVTWPPLLTPSEKEQAETAEITSRAIAAYSSAPEAERVLPLRQYRLDVLKIPQAKVDEIEKNEAEAFDDENEEIDLTADVVMGDNQRRSLLSALIDTTEEGGA